MAQYRPVPRGGPPSLPPDTDLLQSLLLLKPEEWPSAVAQLGLEEGDAFDRDWGVWAHEGQEPPAACPDGSDWRTWVIMAGRGFGKTLAGAKWLTARIATEKPLHIALVGATLDEARRVMVEGRSGLLEVADAWISDWQPSLRRLKFRTGAVATLFSGASPEILRGPEHHLAWCDELAKWEKPQESWDMLQLGLRLGDWPRAIVTTTPRPGPVLAAILGQSDTVRTGGPTSANPHVSEAWQRAVHALYAGTRLGAQELEGRLLPDVPGALWTAELLERCRLKSSPRFRGEGDHAEHGGGAVRSTESPPARFAHAPPPHCARSPSPAKAGEDPDALRFTRLVIAVDPPVGDGTCGIVACAKDSEGQAHILADHSVTAQSPEGWARTVADAVRIHTVIASPAGARQSSGAGEEEAGLPRSARNDDEGRAPLTPLVVAEQNQGGKMVKAVLHTADPTLRVKLVTATVGKAERAAPVAMLFEAGRVVLHGRFPELEAELLGMIAGGDYEGPGVSPDRADALVWGLTELMLTPEQAPPSVRTL